MAINVQQVIRRLFAKSTRLFFGRMNPGVIRQDLSFESEADLRRFKDYMKAHESDWYMSQEFADMFIECPPQVIFIMAKFYYGNGNTIKSGVNLSDRVVECLNAAKNAFSLEQHTFPRAMMCEQAINLLRPTPNTYEIWRERHIQSLKDVFAYSKSRYSLDYWECREKPTADEWHERLLFLEKFDVRSYLEAHPRSQLTEAEMIARIQKVIDRYKNIIESNKS